MLYLERPPTPALRPFIRTLWYCRAPGVTFARERVLPTGCIQILINLSRDYLTDCGEDGAPVRRQPGTLISGARARFEIIDTADLDDLAGLVFEPGGFAPLFHERADLLFEHSISLDNLWRDPRVVDTLRAAPSPARKLDQLDRLLQRLVRPEMRRRELADHALYLFRHNGLSVAGCARSIGVSGRRLSQVFREEVGLSPKLWCRIQRFQAAARALHRGVDMPWAELALRCGYYDQAHFANDFKAFSSIDPTTYSAQPRRWQNHVPHALILRETSDFSKPHRSNKFKIVAMSNYAKACPSTIVPGLKYRNAKVMIDWLCTAFGFEKQAVFLDGDLVQHAQLTFGNGMIMIGSIQNGSASSARTKQPDEIGNLETQSPYLIVQNIDALYAQAKAAGATMLMELEEKDYGGKGFSCLDPEGHSWAFGTYDPWETHA